MNYLKVISVLVILTFHFSPHLIAQENSKLASIWQSLGGKSNWNATQYILFSAHGNAIAKSASGDRKFLLDKKNGRCRYEGKTATDDNLVLLFNYKSKQVKKAYINNTEIKDLKIATTTYLPQILEQFFEDTKLLFLGTSFDAASTTVGAISQKITNAEKTTVFPISSAQLFDGTLFKGKIIINTEGQIIHSETAQGNYLISGYKDVGGGLHLPTLFKNEDSSAKDCIFSTVAAFTDMEEGKFNTL